MYARAPSLSGIFQTHRASTNVTIEPISTASQAESRKPASSTRSSTTGISATSQVKNRLPSGSVICVNIDGPPNVASCAGAIRSLSVCAGLARNLGSASLLAATSKIYRALSRGGGIPKEFVPPACGAAWRSAESVLALRSSNRRLPGKRHRESSLSVRLQPCLSVRLQPCLSVRLRPRNRQAGLGATAGREYD